MRAEAKRFRPLSMAGPPRAMPIAEYFFNHMYTFFGLTRSASSCTMGEKARGATALYKILRKERLNDTTTLMEIHAPHVANKALPGQFIIFRIDEAGERVPLTIADANRETGGVTIIFQKVGATTRLLDALEVGDSLLDFVGPLGKPTQTEGIQRAAVLGGGLGVAYTAADRPASIDQFAETVTSAVHEACARHGVAEPRLLAEPGRSLVANAGVTLYTVGIIKTLPNIRKYVAVDGGMSDNVRTALYHADYEPVVANKAGQPRTEIVTIAGKHCESGDAVVIDMPLQHVDVGDIVAVFGTGAYNHTMASNYNGQPRPAIVFVKDGKARVTTRRETYDDLMSRDI